MTMLDRTQDGMLE